MKKIIALLMAISIVFSLVACSADPETLGEAVGNHIEEQAKEYVENTIVSGATSWWEANIVQPIGDAWASVTGWFSPKVTEKDGKYYSDGKEITNVTLDVIAEAEHKKSFNACSNKQRKNVIRLFAKYNELDPVLVDFIDTIDVSRSSINLEKWDQFEDLMLISSTDFALVNLCFAANKNESVSEFLSFASKGVNVAEVVFHTTKTIFLLKSLSNNNFSDPQAYALECIEVLKELTSTVDKFGYFSVSLSVVAEGVDTLIALAEKHEDKLAAYGEAIDADSIFIGKRWGIVAEPHRWEEFAEAEHAGIPEPSDIGYLSLEDIRDNYSELIDISEIEKDLIEKYIIYRLQFEFEHA